MWYTSKLAVLAVVFFIISFVSYVLSDIPIEAIWWMLAGIFILILPNELRKQA